MIWVTGDKHGQMSAMELPDYKKIKKGDTLLICGDFGFVWDGSKQEQKNLKALSKRKYDIAFVDGCNENFELLQEYPTVDFQGGRARQIKPNIYQLLRGELYEIEGKKILAFGGGAPSNQCVNEDGVPKAWDNLEPTEKEVDKAIASIQSAGGSVDLILTHEPPLSILGCMDESIADGAVIHDVLEQIRTHCKFKKWYFGKFHIDKSIPPYYMALFDSVLPVD